MITSCPSNGVQRCPLRPRPESCALYTSWYRGVLGTGRRCAERVLIYWAVFLLVSVMSPSSSSVLLDYLNHEASASPYTTTYK